MKWLVVNDNNGIRTVQMNRGTGNPLNEELVNEISAIFNESQEDDAVKGVLLTGKDHFFSVGLDLMELYDYNEEAYDRFWESFMKMVYGLASFDKPLVVGVTGHAPAGGCVIAICADYRVMAEGKYKIGLNEVPVGIIVPPSIYELYSLWIGKKAANQYLLEGKLHSVEAAHKMGLVDEVCSLQMVNELALSQLKKYTSLHEGAWRATKRNCRKDLLKIVEPKRDFHFDEAQKQWWRPEVRAALKAYIDKIRSGKKK